MADMAGVGPSGQRVEVRTDALGAQYIRSISLRYLLTNQVSSSGTGMVTLTIPSDAVAAYVHVTAADIYYNFDAGSATPSSTVGDDALQGDAFYIYGPQKLATFRAVRQASVNFTLKCQYYMEQRDE